MKKLNEISENIGALEFYTKLAIWMFENGYINEEDNYIQVPIDVFDRYVREKLKLPATKK